MEISNDHKGAHQTWEKNGLNSTKRQNTQITPNRTHIAEEYNN